MLLLCIALTAQSCSRPAQTASKPAPPPPFEYVDTWGSHGDSPGQLSDPVAIAADGESIIYIADAGNGFVHKFSASGEPRLSFQDDRLDLHPTDIAVDAGAAIYVADGKRGMVLIYFSDGMHHRELRVGALGLVRESMHVGVDAYGTIFVAAKRPFGVHKFSQSLRLVGSWATASSKDAVLENPAALAVGPDSRVYIIDSTAAASQIKIYTSSGALAQTISPPADSADAQLTGLAVNSNYIFAVDATHPFVHIWAVDGTYRMKQDLSAWIPGTAVSPRKAVVTPAGELLVLDTKAARVFRFRLHL